MSWKTVSDHACAVGESPFWHPTEQRLYWLDIDRRKLHRTGESAGSVDSWDMLSEPGCIAPAQTNGQGCGYVIALRSGIYRARQWGGALELLAAAPFDQATTRFNDGKADARGRFWAGTIYEPRDAQRAQLFALDCRSLAEPVLQLKADGAVVANALAWSPDHNTLYWGDTTAHQVRAWDFNADTAGLSGERVFAQWPAKPAKPANLQFGSAHALAYRGRPDGAAVDVEGNCYFAMYEGGCIAVLSPSGELLREIALPAQCPTMPCFGGSDLRTLYVTTASHKRSAAELAAYPQSGCVFALQVQVPGMPVNCVALA